MLRLDIPLVIEKMPVEAVTLIIGLYQVINRVTYGVDVVAILSLTPAKFDVATSLLHYSAAVCLGGKRAVRIPPTAVILILYSILGDLEIVDIAFSKVVYGDIPFRAVDHSDIPYLNDTGTAVSGQGDAGLYVPDLLRMNRKSQGACQ